MISSVTADTVPLAAFLVELGYDTRAADGEARAVLHAAGLSNPRKSGIAADKLPRARAVIEAALVRSCGLPACDAALASRFAAKRLVRVSPASCEHCRGAAGRRAGIDVVARCRALGIRRLLVVGGMNAPARELVAALDGLAVDVVDGTVQRDLRRAKADLARADLVVIWGNTPLDHAMSALYRRPPAGTSLVLVPTRGAASVVAALARHLDRRTASPGDASARPLGDAPRRR